MNLKKGDVWVCQEPYCGAEVEVLRTANSSCHGNFTLRCCCGKDMVPKESAKHPEPHHVGSGEHTSRRS